MQPICSVGFIAILGEDYYLTATSAPHTIHSCILLPHVIVQKWCKGLCLTNNHVPCHNSDPKEYNKLLGNVIPVEVTSNVPPSIHSCSQGLNLEVHTYRFKCTLSYKCSHPLFCAEKVAKSNLLSDINIFIYLPIFEPRHEKICFCHTGTTKFVVRWLDSIIFLVSTSGISNL